MLKLFILFTVLNIINVVLQTVKSIVTITAGKWTSAMVNAIAYGLYQVILVYSVCELPLWQKVLVVALANFIGVFIVKYFEEKGQKEKLWKIEMTVPTKYRYILDTSLNSIPHSYLVISDKHTLFNIYCDTKDQSRMVRQIAEQYDGKVFATETKIL